MRFNQSLFLLLPFLLQSCGSVEIGEERFYRLGFEAYDLGRANGPRRTVLRVGDFSVSPHLSGDRLVTTVRGSRVAPYRYHHWAAPLDQLVTDAVFRSLLSSERFASVIDARDSADADWVITARILDFEEIAADTGWGAQVRLALILREERSGRTIWQGRLEAFVPLETSEPLAVVEALDRGLGQVLKKFARLVDTRAEFLESRAGPVK